VWRQLPVDGRPRASAALAAACDAYANDPRVRDMLPVLLLEDALPVAGLLADLAA
jgi:alpha-D-ribose 1-methylphosphonate 5-triphosphate synthase subunit PhnG